MFIQLTLNIPQKVVLLYILQCCVIFADLHFSQEGPQWGGMGCLL